MGRGPSRVRKKDLSSPREILADCHGSGRDPVESVTAEGRCQRRQEALKSQHCCKGWPVCEKILLLSCGAWSNFGFSINQKLFMIIKNHPCEPGKIRPSLCEWSVWLIVGFCWQIFCWGFLHLCPLGLWVCSSLSLMSLSGTGTAIKVMLVSQSLESWPPFLYLD